MWRYRAKINKHTPSTAGATTIATFTTVPWSRGETARTRALEASIIPNVPTIPAAHEAGPLRPSKTCPKPAARIHVETKTMDPAGPRTTYASGRTARATARTGPLLFTPAVQLCETIASVSSIASFVANSHNFLPWPCESAVTGKLRLCPSWHEFSCHHVARICLEVTRPCIECDTSNTRVAAPVPFTATAPQANLESSVRRSILPCLASLVEQARQADRYLCQPDAGS